MNLMEATILALQNKLLEKYEDSLYNDEVIDEINDMGLSVIEIYNICMDTYNGKRLYLTHNDLYGRKWNEVKSYEWSFDVRGAMQFDTIEEAEKFAKKYFKHFDRWYIHKTRTVM